jgi:hypothetical protein
MFAKDHSSHNSRTIADPTKSNYHEVIVKLIMFLTYSSAFVLSSIAVLCSGQESVRLLANTRGIDQPEFRYVAFDDIGAAKRYEADTGLGYTEDTWNLPGTADVEKLSFGSLTADNQAAAVALGFSEVVWDCYVNHYDDYSWDELATEGVQQYYITLGWTDDAWTTDSSTPASDEEFFGDLTSDQTAAAEELCYNELLWNGESLSGGSTASTTVVLATAIGAAVAGMFFM